MAELELLPFDSRPSTAIIVQDSSKQSCVFCAASGVRTLASRRLKISTCGICVKEGSRGKEGYYFCMLGVCIDLKGGTRKKACYRFPTPSVILERFTTLSGSGLQRWRVLKAQIRRSCVEKKLIREEYLNTFAILRAINGVECSSCAILYMGRNAFIIQFPVSRNRNVTLVLKCMVY